MAGKGKVKTLAIKLLSTAGTGFFYVTTKNPRNVTRKLSLKKVIQLFTMYFLVLLQSILLILKTQIFLRSMIRLFGSMLFSTKRS